MNCRQAGNYLLHLLYCWETVGLAIKFKTFGIVGISIAILLILLGWLGVFAQPRPDMPFPDGFRPRRGGFRSPRGFPPPDESSFIDPTEIERPSPFGDSEFTFARMIYTGFISWEFTRSWTTDWPKSDRQFILGVQRLTNIRVADDTVAVSLTDPDLFNYPFLYSVECGHWDLTDDEIKGLREYLKRGGFLFCDDFWGTQEWAIFQENILKVLPEARITDIPLSHRVFHSYYDIEELVQVPYIRNALYSTRTYEQDGYFPYCKGIFDDNDRLMVMINWNTDLGDAWEWADLPELPARYSTYAYKLGINAIIYAMSH